MSPVLQGLFNDLENQRNALLEEIKNVDPVKLNNSVNNKWSISQISGHLITAEKLSLSYMSKKINAINEVGTTGLFNELVLLIFIISQRLPLKYKAPKNLGDKPHEYKDVNELIDDWDAARKNLREFLNQFPEDGIKKKIYRHPVMGRCNVIHALKFYREHLIHHHPQIKRQL